MDVRVTKIIQRGILTDRITVRIWTQHFSGERERSDFVLSVLNTFNIGNAIILVHMPGGDIKVYLQQLRWID